MTCCVSVGEYRAAPLASDSDVRTDVPLYRVFKDGKETEETDITALWTDDLVVFYLGCSFTFENTLMASGVPVRNVDQVVTCLTWDL